MPSRQIFRLSLSWMERVADSRVELGYREVIVGRVLDFPQRSEAEKSRWWHESHAADWVPSAGDHPDVSDVQTIEVRGDDKKRSGAA